jgi:hypothetical protein
MSIELGDRVKSSINGFQGIVVGYHKWLTGCDGLTVRPEEMKDGKLLEDQGFDVTVVELVKNNAITVGNVGVKETADIPGGPHDYPKQSH